MDVREMGMPVRQRHVLMEMGMGLDAIPIRAVPMLVVLVMAMTVVMRHRLVRVLVFVPLAHVLPDA